MKFDFVMLPLILLLWGRVTAASATAGHVFTFDRTSPTDASTSGQSVSPVTARLILARRLGLSRFHGASDSSVEEIRQINIFGGCNDSLFGEEAPCNYSPSLIWVEGVDDVKDILPLSDSSQDPAFFTITNVPSPDESRHLLDDFARQALFVRDTSPQSSWTPSSGLSLLATAFTDKIATEQILSGADDSASILRVAADSQNRHGNSAAHLRQALTDAVALAKEHGISLTIFVMPFNHDAGSKRTTKSYGSYDVPSQIAKRQQPVTERPLSSVASVEGSMDSNSSIHDQKTNKPEASTAPLRGILPACFSSLEACESTTRNCTGHGQCQLKYNTKNIDGKICYTCACKAEVVDNEDGTQRTYRYGGPACQKQDITTPFWLLAGFSVVMVIVLSWGIGLLYSVGEEQLPSVIGAGVSGPRAK